MYFALAGKLAYLWIGGTHELTKGHWIGEPALWIDDWECRGSLKATTRCEGLKLDVAMFRGILQELCAPTSCPQLDDFVQIYASKFVRIGSDGDANSCGCLYTDVWVDADKLKLLVEQELLPYLRQEQSP